ncbi:MAG: MFS transporter [Chloroflexi bacterium]|nr:MFS transporter [Chloroflexota bacterium]
MPTTPLARIRRIYYGWWVVAAGATLLTYHSGSWWYGFGVLLKPMADEFGWGRAATAGVFSISNLEGGLLGMVSGWLIDRHGPRVVILGGVVLLGLGFVSLSQIDSLAGLYLTYGLLMGVGAHACGIHSYVAAAARWFVKKRARAMGYVSLGGGLGGVLITPLVAVLVDLLGWRATALTIAGGFLVLGLPAAWVIRPRRPEAYGLRPDGEDPVGPVASPATGTSHEGSPFQPAILIRDATPTEALHSRSFWLMSAAWSLGSMSGTSLAVHLVPLLTDRGFSATVAASVIPVWTLMTLPSRLIFPWFADRYDIRLVYAASFLLFAIGMAGLLVAPGLLAVYAAMAVYGFGQGGNVPTRPAILANYFGRTRFGTIQGIMSTVGSIGAMLGPIVTGAVFDVTGSYALGLLLLATASLLAVVCVLFIPRLALVPAAPAAAAVQRIPS